MDHIAKRKIFPRASLQLVTQIVKVLWLFLVNCVENHRKIRKMKSNFVGFVVKYPTTFVILAGANTC
jgi:hypothetical protein